LEGKGERVRSGNDDSLSTGCSSLDSLLGGGFPRRSVSQVYGEPATGKTNVCIQTAVETVENGGGVVYIDTEGLSLRRVQQVGGDGFEDSAKEFIVKEVHDFDEQSVAVRDVENLAPTTDLVVLDSATGLYRVEQEDADDDATPLKRLTRQVTQLAGMARKHDLAVVLTNQIYTAVESKNEDLRPLGGRAMEHWTSIIVPLERSRVDDAVRRATLEKHPARPENDEATFRITDEGIEGEQS